LIAIENFEKLGWGGSLYGKPSLWLWKPLP